MKPDRIRTPDSLHRVIPSKIAEVDPLCLDIRAHLNNHGLTRARFAVELLAREWLGNAIIHGNGRESGRKVILDLLIGRKWIRLQIIDEGAGFNWRRAKRAPLPGDTAVKGRGFPISALYADRIAFNQPGNRVTLWLNKEGKGGLKRHGWVHN